MPEDTTDVKTEVDSSTTSTTDGATAEEVKRDASDSSTEQSSQDGLDKALAEGIARTQAKAEEAKTEAKADVKPDDVKPVDKTTIEDKGPIPYERFQEVVTQRQQFERQFKDAEPYLEAQRTINEHCTRNGITNEEFGYWMNVAALAKSNPEEALKMLQPQLQTLQGYVGDALPKELQDDIANGRIDEAYAKRLWAAENKAKFASKQTQLTQEQIRAQRQQEYTQANTAAFNSWVTNTKGKDPDFAPKANADAPDGKFEMFLYKLYAEAPSAKLDSPESLVAFCEKTLNAVNAAVGRYTPQRNGTKHVTSRQSTSAAKQAPKTMDEAMAMAAAKHGYTLTTR